MQRIFHNFKNILKCHISSGHSGKRANLPKETSHTSVNHYRNEKPKIFKKLHYERANTFVNVFD